MVRSKRPSQPALKPKPAARQEAVTAAKKSNAARQEVATPPPPPSSKRRRISKGADPVAGGSSREELVAPPPTSSAPVAMDTSGSTTGPGPSESSSAPASLLGEEDKHSVFGPGITMRSSSGSGSMQRTGPNTSELGSALGSLFKRASPHMSEEPPSGGVSRFYTMLRDLKSDDGTRQIMALTELSEYLSFSSEEALISFPMETFIPVLIGLLEDPGDGDEIAAQSMVLACRCLFNVVDILPPTTRIITAAGGLPVLCANLLNVAYIDVAELAVAIIEKISEDQPLQVLKAGGLSAILTFLDFFQIAVQRQAASAAVLMLLPIPPSDVFDQHVRPALPTLAQLLQHADPQVLQSVCECWRRLLDNMIAIHTLPKPSAAASSAMGSSSSLGRVASKGKSRGGADRDGKKDRGDEAAESAGARASAAAASSLAVPVSEVLEEICPSGVVSHLLMLLSNGLASPSPHTSIVTPEVLYILAVLTNYSDAFTREVLKQDICAQLRQMVLTMDIAHGGQSSTRSSFCLLRVLALVASMLPAVHVSDSSCECEERRLAVYREEPECLDILGQAFLPVLVDIYEASTDPSLQSLCMTLLLAFFLACRERPETIRRSLDPTRLACLLANLIITGTTKSVMLASLLIVYELLDQHSQPYSLLFVRHGVVQGIRQLVTQDDKSHRTIVASKVDAAEAQKTPPLKRLVDDAAHRVLATYFASSSHIGESEILRALGKIAKQLQSSPTVVIAAHREALNKLSELLLASEGITAFEFICSGVASALASFLHPEALTVSSEGTDCHGGRLKLFLECVAKSHIGAFPRLVRLCVSAVQRSEKQPLSLFPTHAALGAALPPHLRPPSLQQQMGWQPHQMPPGGKGGESGPAAGRGGLGFFGDFFSTPFSSRRGHDSNASGGPAGSLSVLRLLAKPVRVRMAPHGSAGVTSPSDSSTLPNIRTLLMPFGGKGGPGRLQGTQAAAPAALALATAAEPSTSGSQDAPAEAPQGSNAELTSVTTQTAASASSPATRLRNYLASKVSRKRNVGSAGGSSVAGSPAVPPEKRPSGMASLLLATTKGRASAAAAAAVGATSSLMQTHAAEADTKASASAKMEDIWDAVGSWDDDDDSHVGNATDARDDPSSSAGQPSRGDDVGRHPDRDELRRRERDGREHPMEAVEAVLLVEPLAMVSALEEYVWDKHGLRRQASNDAPPGAALSRSTSSAASGSAAAAAAAPSATLEALAKSCGAAGSENSQQTDQPSRLPPQALPAAAFESPTRESRGLGAEGSSPRATSPHTPLAILDLGSPSTLEEARQEAAAAAQKQDEPLDALLTSGEPVAETSSAASGVGQTRAMKRVQVLMNGHPLSSKMNVVQAVVNHAGRNISRARSKDTQESSPRQISRERFLVSTEDDSNSDAEDADGGAVSSSSGPLKISSRHFCGTIWGRVHSMTYEIIDEQVTLAPGIGERASTRPSSTRGGSGQVVLTDFDCLVQRHSRIPDGINAFQASCLSAASAMSSSSSSPAAIAPAPDGDDAAAAEATSAGGQLEPTTDCDSGQGTTQREEELPCLLQLISAFHNMNEFLQSQGNFAVGEGAPVEDDFLCNSLTAKLLRQLSDPLAICAGSIPPWCMHLTRMCRFLFPYNARRVLHHSCSLGLSRALHHVQQRLLAQNAGGADAQRRLEGEVTIASIPRQKVRISRQRILESAVKVMNHYGGGSTILEVEYVGEVGTGSGPTLEFYAQVAEILRTSEPRLFRKGAPGGLLFPEPVALAPGSEGTAGEHQVILERFRLLGQVVAKSILDNRLVDLQLHPYFWRAVLNTGPFCQQSLREVDPELYSSMNELGNMQDEALAQMCIDFTLPGHPEIELKPDGAGISLCRANVDEYMGRVAEVSLVTAIAPQVAAFRSAFGQLLPLETCQIWSERELASIVVGASVRDDAVWTIEHLGAHIKAQHGYNAESWPFRDLLLAMADFSVEDRRKFLTFVTGAPTLPIGGFGGLRPPLTVVKKEAPPAPLTPDQFMPSVMTCANYLKLPEYSSGEILRQKLVLAMSEGQSAFLLS